jgi:hypothetical protein
MFQRKTEGGILLTFALSLAVIVLFVLVVLDLGDANSVDDSRQEALDASALSGVRELAHQYWGRNEDFVRQTAMQKFSANNDISSGRAEFKPLSHIDINWDTLSVRVQDTTNTKEAFADGNKIILANNATAVIDLRPTSIAFALDVHDLAVDANPAYKKFFAETDSGGDCPKFCV